jgi:hypothetical protein
VTLASAINVNGVGSEWALGSALNQGSNFIQLFNGVFNSANYSITGSGFGISENSVTLTLGSSTCTFNNSNPFYHITSGGKSLNFVFNVNTSSITFSALTTQNWNSPITFYNVTLSDTSVGTTTLSNADETYNNLTIAGQTNAGLRQLVLRGSVTINGTLTLSAGTNATMRHFLRSDTIGTTRTLTCAAVASLTDIDFRDITIAGAAAPVSGTRLGDCKGNSGITFGAGATKYWNLAGSNNWSATGWATGSGGTPAVNDFPLAQDTAVFEATSPGTGTTTTINAAYNIGTIDMSARTSNTMTLATGTQNPFIYGNWINGTGTTLSGNGTLTWSGRGSQTITSAGRTFTTNMTIDNPGGIVSLSDALSNNYAGGTIFTITIGTFDAAGYNVTFSGGGFASTNSNTRTIAIGSGTWSFAGGSPWNCATSTNLTVTGTGTISLTSASAKTFAGGGIAYTNITLDQGGAGALTITGNNTFANITNTYSATGATNITIGTTTQRVTQWTATGAATRVLTVQGTSASSPGTLILTGGNKPNVDYLTVTGVRAYSLDTTWYAGANSTNNGSLGWYFESGVVSITATISETSTATDAVSAVLIYISSLSETSTATDTVDAPGSTFNPSLSEAATATDAVAGTLTLLAQVADALTGTDTVSVTLTISPSVSETATATDEVSSKFSFAGIILESATATDATSTTGTFNPSLAETSTATDSDSVTSTFNPSVSESAAGVDTASAVYTSNPSVSETATGTDVVSPQYNANPSVAESATITDAVSPKYNANPSVAETATATDSDSATAVFTPSLSETATATDAPSTANNTFNPSLAETATGTDSPVANLSVTGAVSETATATDTTQSVVIFVGAVSETATATDLISALTNFLGQIAETATATDITLVAPSVFGPQVQEAVAALDLVSTFATFNVQLVESATVLDSVIGAFLWNLIDDNQNPNWVNISNPQNPGWSVIDDSQNPNWQNTNNV